MSGLIAVIIILRSYREHHSLWEKFRVQDLMKSCLMYQNQYTLKPQDGRKGRHKLRTVKTVNKLKQAMRR